MDAFKFKTNIKCSGCIAQVSPHLDEAAGQTNWKVDIQNPGKILTVSGNELHKETIIEAVKRAGFDIEEISA